MVDAKQAAQENDLPDLMKAEANDKFVSKADLLATKAKQERVADASETESASEEARNVEAAEG